MTKEMKKYLLAFCVSLSSLVATAQDWQTGGGADLPRSEASFFHHEHAPYHGYNSNYFDLFAGNHEDVFCALSIGYVNKCWSTDFGDYTWRENFWGEEGKRLHGVQVGLTFQPCHPIGIGLHSGLFYEGYFSVSSAVKEMGWDNFTESSLYLPLACNVSPSIQ